MSQINKVNIVARKEFMEIIHNKRVIITGGFFALWFCIIFGLGDSTSTVLAANSIFQTTLLLGLFLGLFFSGQVFTREKREHIIETLMCSPLSLKNIWLGKVVGATIPAYLLSLATFVIFTIVENIHSNVVIVPEIPLIFHVFLIVPIFIATVVGMFGFAQFLFGMRETQIIGSVVFIVFFAGFYGLSFIGGTANDNQIVTWEMVSLMLVASVSLFTLVNFLAKYMSKEKIVTTIP